MKRRPEAKRELYPLCSVHRFDRPVDIKCIRRGDGYVLLTFISYGSLMVEWSNYGSILLVTATCGPA